MPEYETDWPMLTRLSKQSLSVQRRFLRLHEEAGFGADDQEEIDFRRQLDAELGEIAIREFRAQCGIAPAEWEPSAIPHFGELLRTSPPFQQYLNVYLYFGVRFAAGRILDPCARPEEAEESDCNETKVALPKPPICQEGWNNNGVADQFLNLVGTNTATAPKEKALRFLDGFTEKGEKKEPQDNSADSEVRRFELWLRRLYFDPHQQGFFSELESGILEWVDRRYTFYTDLEQRSEAKREWVDKWKSNPWKEGLWTVNNPLAARCALVDFYWLAKLLRADVSQQGKVRYHDHSWLSLIATRRATDAKIIANGQDTKENCTKARYPNPADRERAEMLRREEVLRSVFGYACDLIQNAVEIAEECRQWRAHPEEFAFPPAAITDPGVHDGSWRPEAWREVEDREHIEIAAQRAERLVKPPSESDASRTELCPEAKKPSGWSRRVWTGEQVENLFGLAISGGGIRSATFNLGVLQKLQELDLLRKFDYLSTVSGGGYIGAWLIGNVRRTRYWLSRMTNWDQSIEHLRKYSNYLAPHNGVLSPDSWSMYLTWVRNAFLIQVTGFLWLALMLIGVLAGRNVFEWVASETQRSPLSAAHIALAICMLIILVLILFFLSKESAPKEQPSKWIYSHGDIFARSAAGVAWLGSFITAGLLWQQVLSSPSRFTSFLPILESSFNSWSPIVKGTFAVAILLLVYVSSLKAIAQHKVFGAILAVILVPAASYLTLCAELRIFGALLDWACRSGNCAQMLDEVKWLAYAIGPTMTMLAIALSIVVFIGLLGRDAPDWTREWWTRYGAWIAMIGAGSLLLTAAAVLAPWAILRIAHLEWKTVTGALAWIGSVISGLLAGKSSKTGEGNGSKTLEIVARAGGFLFIVGAVSLGSTVVYLILTESLGSDTATYAQNLQMISANPKLIAVLILTAFFAWVCSNRFDLNTFGLNQFYRNRLVRCYLGATRWEPGKRKPHPFTGFDKNDDLFLSDLQTVGLGNGHTAGENFCKERFRGPFPIINCTLNLGGSSDLEVHTRQGASFMVTPLFAGASRKKVGYAPTLNPQQLTFAGGVRLGEAISVSGAAASPNMGYNTSPLVSFLLTLFNVRLAWWFPNPASERFWDKDRAPSGSGIYLASELLGLANENRGFVNVSDGGHFENLGVYELIRRKARVIIACDAECDQDLSFGSLGNLVRICETDFGAQIDLDVTSIRKESNKMSRAHCAVGKITYSNGTQGYLIYLKASITGDEDIGVEEYRSGHPTFPHESTSNQFYREDQFEAYRRLGHHIADRAFRDAEDEPSPVEVATKLFDVWSPAGFSTASYLQHSATVERILDRFSSDSDLYDLFKQVTGTATSADESLSPPEHAACLQLLQLMQNVVLDLRLDDFWDYPDNRGWAMLFTGFARSPKFRTSWNLNRTVYGIRFEYFCSQRLGLQRDRPILRV
jgi:hypothetical protein